MHLVDPAGAQILFYRGNAAAEANVLAFRGALCLVQSGFDAVGHEVKGRPAVHDEGGAGMVGEHEDRHVIGRVVAPPALPAFIRPRPPDRTEHVATQDPSADILETTLREIIVNAGRTPILAEHRPEGLGRKCPLMERHAAFAERIVQALVRTGAITVKGEGEATDI